MQRSAPQPYPSQKSSALRRRLVVGGLVVLALALITVSFRASGLTPVQNVGATILEPFQVAGERVARPFRDAGGWLSGLVHAKSENAHQRKQVDELRNQVIQERQAAQDNAWFRKTLHYLDSPRFPQDYNGVPTRVISPPRSSFEQTIVIEGGRNAGFRRDDPVVTPDGLVGKLAVVGTSVSKVTLLTDESSAVAATDLNTPGATGIVKHGQGGVDTLVFDGVQKSLSVSDGDPVITQGSPADAQLKSIYPRGIKIGVVSSVNQRDTDTFKEIQVQPFVDFASLSSVIVLVPKATAGG